MRMSVYICNIHQDTGRKVNPYQVYGDLRDASTQTLLVSATLGYISDVIIRRCYVLVDGPQ